MPLEIPYGKCKHMMVLRLTYFYFPRKRLEGKEMTEEGNGERDPSEPGAGPSGPCLVRAHM